IFTLPAPEASFASTLTELPILPLGALNAKAVAGIASHPTRPMATSGVYRVSAEATAAMILEPNPYASRRPRLADYQLKLYGSFADAATAFARGEIDAMLATTPAQRARLLQVHGATAHTISTFRFVDMLMNQRVPGLNDVTVRHAIEAVVDRAAIVSGALRETGGVAQPGAITVGLPWVTHSQ